MKRVPFRLPYVRRDFHLKKRKNLPFCLLVLLAVDSPSCSVCCSVPVPGGCDLVNDMPDTGWCDDRSALPTAHPWLSSSAQQGDCPGGGRGWGRCGAPVMGAVHFVTENPDRRGVWC